MLKKKKLTKKQLENRVKFLEDKNIGWSKYCKEIKLGANQIAHLNECIILNIMDKIGLDELTIDKVDINTDKKLEVVKNEDGSMTMKAISFHI